MELKTKYNYTYFIYPYLVDKSRYDKYIMKLLKNKKCEFKIFEKEKDMGIYTYFLPHFRNYLFSSFEFRDNKLREFKKSSLNIKSKILASQPSVSFTCNINQNLKGKACKDDNGLRNIF